MANPEEPRASLAERHRRGPARSRRPLASLASFAVLLAVSWPVAAIAKRDHGHNGGGASAGERHSSSSGHGHGKGRRGGGGHSTGDQSGPKAGDSKRHGNPHGS